MTNDRSTFADRGWQLQSQLLLGVSRTFALTIPQLPDPLQRAVGNGYLLCRIADTIEDDPGLTLNEKSFFYDEFLAVLNGTVTAQQFADQLHPKLSDRIIFEEHELIRLTPQVIELTRSLNSVQQSALIRCVTIMSRGMYEFQSCKSLNGLHDVQELSRYCYVVAGVVGEMLTELFCDYSDVMQQQRDEMMALSVCFGQGLQLTNILKDIWEDRQDGSCWLPRSLFCEESLTKSINAGSGCEPHTDNDTLLKELMCSRQSDKMTDGISHLVGIAAHNLNSALSYTRLIPRHEVGIRRFCLWAIGMAVTTLQKIHRNPGYSNGAQVKISRSQVWTIVKTLNVAMHSDRLVSAWFKVPAMGLPRSNDPGACDPDTLNKIVSSHRLQADAGSAQ